MKSDKDDLPLITYHLALISKAKGTNYPARYAILKPRL